MRRVARPGLGVATACIVVLLLAMAAPVYAETITVLFASDKPWIPDAAARFEASTGIQVELIQVDWNNINTRVVAGAAARVAPYDVVEVDYLWLGPWVNAGILEPLDGYMTPLMKEEMVGSLLEAGRIDGKLYAVPWLVDSLFFMYNTRMFEAAGIESPPETWEELIDTAVKLQSAGIVRWPVIMNWTQHEGLVCNYLVFLHTLGGSLYDSNGQVQVDTADGVRALEFMLRLKNSGITDPASMAARPLEAVTALSQGLTAMTMAWGSLFPQTAEGVEAGNIAIGLIPSQPGVPTATVDGSEAVAIMKASQHKEAAWKFVEFITSKEYQREVLLQYNVLPAWSSLYEDPALAAQMPYLAVMGRQLDHAVTRPQVSWYNEFSRIMQVAILEALHERTSPSVALKDAAARVAQLTR